MFKTEDKMIKELFFIKKAKKINVIHIRQHLERQGFELVSMKSDLGRDLREMLSLNFAGEKALVYASEKIKYVFYNPDLNEEDLEYVLLHECGHIHLKHKTNSMQNEAEAWNFAHTVKNIHKKITKAFALMIVSVLLTASINYLLFNCVYNQSADIKAHSKETLSTHTNAIQKQEKVYITANGTKYHIKDCIFIRDKKTISCNKDEAAELFLPCSSCIK